MATKRKNPAAVALGRRGGNARRAKLTEEQRSESARKAAQTRWAKAAAKPAKKAAKKRAAAKRNLIAAVAEALGQPVTC